MKSIEATITETDASLYSVDINTNGHLLVGDEPESYGSQNLGPAPYDLLLAALGECIVMTHILEFKIKKFNLFQINLLIHKAFSAN